MDGTPACLGTPIAHCGRLAPALCLIAEARAAASHVLGWPTHGALEEGTDPCLEYLIGGQADGVLEPLRSQELVQLRHSEGGIGP
jgi:hypothetical protein